MYDLNLKESRNIILEVVKYCKELAPHTRLFHSLFMPMRLMKILTFFHCSLQNRDYLQGEMMKM